MQDQNIQVQGEGIPHLDPALLIKENNELREETNDLKTKIAFSLGALEGIGYLLKNDESKNLDHIRSTINRVIDDLRNDLRG